MPTRFKVTDPRNRTVICTDEIWYGHICEGHSDMAGREEEVKATIQKPQYGMIYRDVDEEDRDVYYRQTPGKRYYVKVVVKFDSRNQGLVISAYRVSAPKSGELIIWPE